MHRAALACVMMSGLSALACGPADPATPTGFAPGRRPAPPPRVSWRDRDIAISGLPAVADDGGSVVVAFRDSDGGRGNPNLTLFEKDRSDRVLRRVQVLSPEDVERLQNAEIALRFEAASSWLDERHAARHLVAMIPLELHPQTDEGPAFASGPGVTLRWAPSTLTIDLGPGAGARSAGSASGSGTGSGAAPAAGATGTQITRTTPASWLVADRPLCATCTEVCHNDAFLGGAYLDRKRRIAVVVVSYRGSDTCWEPGSPSHVVTW